MGSDFAFVVLKQRYSTLYSNLDSVEQVLIFTISSGRVICDGLPF